MNRALLSKSIYEGLALLIACSVGAFSFAWFRVWVVSLLDSLRFKQIIDLLPKEFEKFSPVEFEWLISFIGRTAMTLEEPMLIMLVSLWVIVRGSDIVSGELNRGTMEMLLAQPVSRNQVYWTAASTVLAGLLALVVLIWTAMAIGVAASTVTESRYPEFRVPFTETRIPLTFMEPIVEKVPMSVVVSPRAFVPGCVNLATMGIFLFGMTTLISSVDRYRWRTLGIVFGIYMGFGMLELGAMASPLLNWLKYFTVFTLYDSQSHIKLALEAPRDYWSIWIQSSEPGKTGLGPLGGNLILLVSGVGMLIAGSRLFHRRDLPAPM